VILHPLPLIRLLAIGIHQRALPLHAIHDPIPIIEPSIKIQKPSLTMPHAPKLPPLINGPLLISLLHIFHPGLRRPPLGLRRYDLGRIEHRLLLGLTKIHVLVRHDIHRDDLAGGLGVVPVLLSVVAAALLYALEVALADHLVVVGAKQRGEGVTGG
jgi:hypothetical protein